MQFRMTIIVLPFAVEPEDDVPPLDVLKMMFRKYNKTMEPACLHPINKETYDEWVQEMIDAYATRQSNLKASDLKKQPGKRKKRAIRRSKRSFVKPQKFCATLEPKDNFQGVQPLDGILEKSRICSCDKQPPSARYWKQLKYKVAYIEAMEDPTSQEFKKIKLEVEKKVPRS